RALTGPDRDRAEERVRALEGSLPPPLPAISTVRNVEAERTSVHVLKRGNEEAKGRLVGPRLPPAPAGAESRELPPGTRHPRTPRTGRAGWVASPDTPLRARVMVNRLWLWHFGRGIVETANDFGVNGSPPSHPELLDWLAREFVAGGWRIKPVHRLIVTSA